MRVISTETIDSWSKTDRAYLSFATYVASQSDCRMKHGAVIVKGGRVIATAVNTERNRPEQVSEEHIKTHCSVHAEVNALRRAKKVKGATIYVARSNRSGDPIMSRPCDRCYKQIKRSGIKKVVYTG